MEWDVLATEKSYHDIIEMERSLRRIAKHPICGNANLRGALRRWLGI